MSTDNNLIRLNVFLIGVLTGFAIMIPMVATQTKLRISKRTAIALRMQKAGAEVTMDIRGRVWMYNPYTKMSGDISEQIDKMDDRQIEAIGEKR